MFELLLIAQCVTQFPDGQIVNIEGICATPEQINTEPVRQQESAADYQRRQNQPGSELNQIYLKVFAETYCSPEGMAIANIHERKLFAMVKAQEFSTQWNTFWFVFIPDTKMTLNLGYPECN